MKRIIVVVFLEGALLVGNAHGFDLEDTKDAALKGAAFAGGLVAAGLVHELGHQVEAWRTGEPMNWHGLGKWHENGHRYSTSLKMAGLAANALSSEAVLALTPRDRGWFLTGLLVGNIIEQVTYPTLRSNDGDFVNIPDERKRRFQFLFVGHGLFTAARMIWNSQRSEGESQRSEVGGQRSAFKGSKAQFFMAPVPDGAVAGVRWEW